MSRTWMIVRLLLVMRICFSVPLTLAFYGADNLYELSTPSILLLIVPDLFSDCFFVVDVLLQSMCFSYVDKV